MGKNVKVWFDEETDILYLSLKEVISVDSEEVAEDVRVEYDKQVKLLVWKSIISQKCWQNLLPGN